MISRLTKVIKAPRFNGDDYLFRFPGNQLPTGDSITIRDKDLNEYVTTKLNAFRTKNTDPKQFEPYIEARQSLRSLCKLETLDATIYTVACERANGVSWEDCISSIKQILNSSPKTRRAVLRFANPVHEYADSVRQPRDVTCLSMIHFLRGECRLVFRASDIEKELLPDLLTINEFFLAPVYEGGSYEVTVYASTAQGFSSFNKVLNEILRMSNARM